MPKEEEYVQTSCDRFRWNNVKSIWHCNTKNKRSKIEGYALVESLLKRDVTEEFLSKFKKLFRTIVEPELPLLYEEINDGTDNT